MTKIHKSHSVQLGDARPVIHHSAQQDTAAYWLNQAAAHALVQADEQYLSERRSTAERLVEQATLRAEAILLEARQQAESIERDAFASGFASGIQKAQAEYEKKARQLEEAFQAAVSEINAQSMQQLDQLEPELVELSVTIAEKILDMELNKNEQAFLSLVRSALAKLKSCDKIECRVQASDLAHLTAQFGYSLQGGGQALSFKADPTLETGSLILESESGIVNASAPVQLEKIRQQLSAVSG